MIRHPKLGAVERRLALVVKLARCLASLADHVIACIASPVIVSPFATAKYRFRRIGGS